MLRWNNLKQKSLLAICTPRNHANLLQSGNTVRRTNLCRSNMYVNKLHSWIQIVYSNQLYSTGPYTYPRCPCFGFSQVKPIKWVHKNRGHALFASCANRTQLFFQSSLAFLIFTRKENHGNAISDYSEVAPAHKGAILQRDARYVQLGKMRRNRRAGRALWKETPACTHCAG